MDAALFRESFSRLTPDLESCDAFLRVADPDALAGAEHLGLAMVAPESFGLGVARSLAGLMEDRGYLLLDAAVLDRLTEEQASAMFLPGWMPRRFRFWLIQKRFTMGPCAAFLLTHPDPEPVACLLAADKGHRLPPRARAGTWRKELGAINGLLNLVHTADDPIYVVRNAAPFFSPGALAGALASVERVRRSGVAPLGWEAVQSGLLSGYEAAASSCERFPRVYGSLLHRLAAGEHSLRPSATLSALLAALTAWLDAPVRGDGPSLEDVLTRLAEVLSEGLDGPRRAALNALGSLHRAHDEPWDLWCRRIEAAGVRLDGWEELVLQSTLFYADEEFPEELLASAAALLER